jgi:flavorubredoxin
VAANNVRWIFISHDDADHVGNLHELLERCPNATLVASFFLNVRQVVERPLPLNRMVWREAGASFDAGDRTLQLVLPPLFDGATTRGLFDGRTGVLWAVDAYAAMVPGPVFDAADVPADMFDDTFRLLNSIGAPWHQWLDRVAFGRHLDRIEALRPTLVASAHGPLLSGARIADALERCRALAGAPVTLPPGQPMLDELVAQLLGPEAGR